MTSEMGNILEQVADEFANAEVFNEWKPPDGEYTTLIVAYSDGVSTRGSNKYAWWTLTGRLLCPSDPELDQKEYTIGPYRSSAVGFLKGAMSVLAGEKVNDVKRAEPLLSAAVGKIVNVRVRTTENERGTYTNTTITAVVEDVPEAK